jgi:cob(I)alamin adenosyltransferase
MVESEKEQGSQHFAEGLVNVFTGNGKGKTTAALGTALRAAGQGFQVYIVHFMKGDYPYGEQKAMAHIPNVTVARFGQQSFVNPTDVKDIDREEASAALKDAREAMLSGKYDLVVLDEVNVATGWGLLELDELLKFLDEKPKNVELILTGRYADSKLIERADLVTEMKEIKHPFQKGITARRGLEW